MTPLERELLIERLGDWVISAMNIQSEFGDGKNGSIHDLKIDIIELRDTLKGLEK